ncbi:hypothetical protein AVEN_182370-1 [Araneus ventricosus]|uniref:Uncharacterized protein n=1 Tax=Araneus ventricosus TaxID=182803 RepID=A0A4Y2NPB3_ARAVE|nr:hypothetical protein AVEN_182370-1 [Araneus ventricosus]
MESVICRFKSQFSQPCEICIRKCPGVVLLFDKYIIGKMQKGSDNLDSKKNTQYGNSSLTPQATPPGPAFSRLDQLLPFGPRFQGALRKNAVYSKYEFCSVTEGQNGAIREYLLIWSNI